MSDRRSRSKGARTDRGIVAALQAHCLAAVRVPLSGAVGGPLRRRYYPAADGP
jgi:Holliday junction resolvase